MSTRASGKPRAALYKRVSTGMQERDGTSLESQHERCVAYAVERGWEIVRVEEETASASDVTGRPKLDALLTLARAGQIDALVVYHIDRFSRDTDDQGWLKTEFRRAGVELAFVTGEHNRVLQAVQGAMAQDELEKIRERTKRGKAQTAKNGKYLPGGAPPFGYRFRLAMVGRVERVTGLDEDPLTATTVREMYEFVARGGTATGCAEWLNDREVRSPRGGRWRHPTVCVILQNPLYKGEPRALRYELHRDDRTRKTTNATRAESEWVPLPPDVASALVSHELWQRAMDQLAAGQRGARRNNPEPEAYLLRAGLVKCGYCGGVMSASRVNGRPTYRCTQRAQKGCQSSGAILAEELDAAVWGLVTLVLNDRDWIRQQLREQAGDASVTERVKGKQAELRRLRQEEERLVARLGQLIDPTAVITRLNQVADRRREVEAEIDGLLLQQQQAERIAERLTGFDRRFHEAWERMEQMTYEERRAVLRDFGVEVTLWKRDHDPRYAIDWAFDLGEDWPPLSGDERDEPVVQLIWGKSLADSTCARR